MIVNAPLTTAETYIVPLPISVAALAVIGVNSGVDPAAQLVVGHHGGGRTGHERHGAGGVRSSRRELLDRENDLLQIRLGNPGDIGRHSVPPVARSGTTPAKNVQDVIAGIRTLKRE